MFNRLVIFSAVVAMAAFAAAIPAPDTASTNLNGEPLDDGLTLAGAAGNFLGTTVGIASHTAQRTWRSTKEKAREAGEKTDAFINQSKEVTKDAATAAVNKTHDIADDAKKTTKAILKATADALAVGTKCIVGTVAWGATGLYIAGEKGVQAIGDFSHAAKERVVVILRPMSPSNIKRKAEEGFIYMKNSADSLAYEFTCNYDQGYALVFKPNTKEVFCDKDGKREVPIKCSDAEKETNKNIEYEVSACEVNE
jgi:hypothetical protein